MDNEQLLAELDKRLTAVKDELIERIADSQTEVLRAFYYNWAKPIDARLRAMEERQGSMDSRLLSAEEKISNLGAAPMIPGAMIGIAALGGALVSLVIYFRRRA